MIEVHLKRRILWWNNEKLCTIRKFSGTLETLHLEIIEGQGYVVFPFKFPDEFGNYSTQGLTFPIKESVEWVEDIKAQQAALPEDKKESAIDNFLEEYRDYCRSNDKGNWIPKKLRKLFGYD